MSRADQNLGHVAHDQQSFRISITLVRHRDRTENQWDACGDFEGSTIDAVNHKPTREAALRALTRRLYEKERNIPSAEPCRSCEGIGLKPEFKLGCATSHGTGEQPAVTCSCPGGEPDVSPCCGAAVTYHDTMLCCKACWEEVAA